MTAEVDAPRVVVTGASGFIARAVIDELRTRNIPVIAAARRTLELSPGVDSVLVDDYGNLSVPPGAPIIHLAGEARIAIANRHGAAHVAAERELAQRICTHAASRIVYGSSAQIYGDSRREPHSPDEAAVGNSPYSEAKLMVERLVCGAGGVAARLSNVYGPGMSATLISDIIAQIPAAGPLRLLDASSRRDFLWVGDAARGLVDMALGGPSGVFNLASGTTHSASEVARLALSIAQENNRSLEITREDGGSSVIALDIEKTVAAFGWRPSFSLEQGIRLLLEKGSGDEVGRDA